MKRFIAILVAFALSMCLLSCGYNSTYDEGYENENIRLVDQEKLADIVMDRFIDIDQFRFGNRTLSLDEAEAYLYCWADESSGIEVSEDELREAIWVVLESTDLIRELIAEIDEIDVE